MANRLFSSHQLLYLALGLLLANCAYAQVSQPLRTTLDAVGYSGQLSAGLADAQALVLRGTWDFEDGNVLRLEALEETKFSRRGGVAGVGFVKAVSPDWSVAANLALGHGGINWASTRVDIEASAKWDEARNIVTRAGVYHAQYEGDRSDRGLRLALVDYLPNALVLEAGVILNVSEPGAVHSQMPFISATLGQEGRHYVTLRLSSGSEAYQAVDVDRQLVDFDSQTLNLAWRAWVNRQWGVIVQAEHYRNPSYERNTLGAGLFRQW